MTYTILNVDGTRAPWTPAAGTPSLAELQGIVGGYVERLRVPGGALWMNEDGRLKQLPPNVQASHIAARVIVGTALHEQDSEPGETETKRLNFSVHVHPDDADDVRRSFMEWFQGHEVGMILEAGHGPHEVELTRREAEAIDAAAGALSETMRNPKQREADHEALRMLLERAGWGEMN